MAHSERMRYSIWTFLALVTFVECAPLPVECDPQCEWQRAIARMRANTPRPGSRPRSELPDAYRLMNITPLGNAMRLIETDPNDPDSWAELELWSTWRADVTRFATRYKKEHECRIQDTYADRMIYFELSDSSDPNDAFRAYHEATALKEVYLGIWLKKPSAPPPYKLHFEISIVHKTGDTDVENSSTIRPTVDQDCFGMVVLNQTIGLEFYDRPGRWIPLRWTAITGWWLRNPGRNFGMLLSIRQVTTNAAGERELGPQLAFVGKSMDFFDDRKPFILTLKRS